jgi:integral membrane protein
MTSRTVFLWVGRAEAASFLLLLGVAMPLKYAAGQPEAVRWVGMAHGLLFVAYVLLLAQVAVAEGWPGTRAALGVVASVVPFGPLLFERQLHR